MSGHCNTHPPDDYDPNCEACSRPTQPESWLCPECGSRVRQSWCEGGWADGTITVGPHARVYWHNGAEPELARRTTPPIPPFEVAMNTLIAYLTANTDAGADANHPLWDAVSVIDQTVIRREQRHQQAVRKNGTYRRAIRQIQRAHDRVSAWHLQEIGRRNALHDEVRELRKEVLARRREAAPQRERVVHTEGAFLRGRTTASFLKQYFTRARGTRET